jgi:allophanate hydrolase subunit 2
VGTIISADFHLLGQVMPEDKVIFHPVSLQQAYEALDMQKSLLENPATVEML